MPEENLTPDDRAILAELLRETIARDADETGSAEEPVFTGGPIPCRRASDRDRRAMRTALKVR
jgi:hypothetical protein